MTNIFYIIGTCTYAVSFAGKTSQAHAVRSYAAILAHCVYTTRWITNEHLSYWNQNNDRNTLECLDSSKDWIERRKDKRLKIFLARKGLPSLHSLSPFKQFQIPAGVNVLMQLLRQLLM